MDRKVQVLDFVKINPAGNITILIDNIYAYEKEEASKLPLSF